MTQSTITSGIATMTRQGTPVDLATAVTSQGDLLADKVAQLKAASYEFHTVWFEPVLHEQRGDIGGVQIHHGDCCPGRMDAVVWPAQIRMKVVQS